MSRRALPSCWRACLSNCRRSADNNEADPPLNARAEPVTCIDEAGADESARGRAVFVPTCTRGRRRSDPRWAARQSDSDQIGAQVHHRNHGHLRPLVPAPKPRNHQRPRPRLPPPPGTRARSNRVRVSHKVTVHRVHLPRCTATACVRKPSRSPTSRLRLCSMNPWYRSR